MLFRSTMTALFLVAAARAWLRSRIRHRRPGRDRIPAPDRGGARPGERRAEAEAAA